MASQPNETSDEYVKKDRKSHIERLRPVQGILLFRKGTKPQYKEIPRVEIIIVPVPKVEIKSDVSKYEGTLRERCKMRKKTSRRRIEFEAAKARQEPS